MFRNIALLPLPLLLSAQTTLELEKIEVNASSQQIFKNHVVPQKSWLNDSELFQKETFLKSAPMQQQISVEQALEHAGTNGDPLNALKSFAGVTVKGDRSGELYIHGSKPYETKYTINHLPIAYLYHLAGYYSVIAPEATAQIDAYLGGFDTSYYAMGAVVDITPKYPVGSGKGRVHLGMYDADFAYDGKIDNSTNFFIGGRRSYFDFIADDVIEEFDKDENDPTKKTTFTVFPQFYDAQMILVKTIGIHAFSLEGFMASDKFKLNDTMQKYKDPVAQGKINFSQSSKTLGGRWMVGARDYNADTLLYFIDSNAHTNLFDADYYVNENNKGIGIYHESVFLFEDHKPTVGFEASSTKIDLDAYIINPPMEDYDSLVTDQTAIRLKKSFRANYFATFVQDLWDITDRDHVRYGLRGWDLNFQNFSTGIDPRVAYVYDFSDDASISAAVGRYSQMPQAITIIDGFGNPKIDTFEHSDHYVLGLQIRFQDASILKIEPYYKKFDNLAISDDTLNYKTVGKGQAHGIDITYKKNIDDLDLIVSYTLVNAKRQLSTATTHQYRFSGDVPNTFQVSTNYRFHNDWRMSGYVKYSDGLPYTAITGTENYVYNGNTYVRPIYGTPYAQRLPYSLDVDVQIAKKQTLPNGKSLEYSVELMNLNALFRKNPLSVRYDDAYKVIGYEEEMGFLPAFHITYRF